MRGAGHAAAQDKAKQNTSEVQTQQMSTIAMSPYAASRVPCRLQAFDLEQVATLIPGNPNNTYTVDYGLATILASSWPARLPRTSMLSLNCTRFVLN